ncbi:MAG: hypothetical protein HY820_07485 [Acidobacteria bacterium]|nr:hypothetical protein [Acidobacteriota bacterium]
MNFVFVPNPKTALQQHYHNLSEALKLDLTVQQRSEINGERMAAQHMEGDQHPFRCLCDHVSDDHYNNVRDDDKAEENICSECDYQAPGMDEWKMVKGWNGGGTGIDQIWIQPPDWNWLDPENPPLEEVRIVEAKGGNANLSTGDTYVGEYGPDGMPIGEEGVAQMSREWVYIACNQAANSSQMPSEYKAVATAVRNFLTGKGDEDLIVTGVVLQDGRPLRDDELPKVHFDMVDEDGMFDYEPVGEDDREETMREKLAEFIDKFGGSHKKVKDVCSSMTDEIEESDLDDKYIKAYKNSVQQVGQFFTTLKPGSHADKVYINHYLNTLAKMKEELDRVDDLAERFFRKIFPDLNSNLATPENLKKARKSAKKKALSQIVKNLNEISGEIEAAEYMRSKGAQMVRGWSGGDTGIDQIWVQSDSSPNFDIGKSPWPGDIKIMIVEAKGGSSQLNKGAVYKGKKLSTGVTMDNGCKQMDSNWVLHHADDLTTGAEKAPGDHFLGHLIQQGIKTGNPPIRGIGLKGKTPMVKKDFIHIKNLKVEDGDVTNFNNVKLVKYGP